MSFPTRVRLVAAWLALLGQATVAFGLPVPSLLLGQKSMAACGCTEADRSSGRCCCAKSGGASACCRAKPQPEPEVPPCCAAKKRKAQKPSCCASSPTKPKPEKDEPEPKSRPFDFSLVGGILTQRCLGDLDSNTAPLIYASMPSADPVELARDASFRHWLRFPSERSDSTSMPPVEPPPR